jgi:hypothetical protein
MKYAGVKLWKGMETFLGTPEGKISYRNQQEHQFPSSQVWTGCVGSHNQRLLAPISQGKEAQE